MLLDNEPDDDESEESGGVKNAALCFLLRQVFGFFTFKAMLEIFFVGLVTLSLSCASELSMDKFFIGIFTTDFHSSVCDFGDFFS